jgi:hypothetical protein
MLVARITHSVQSVDGGAASLVTVTVRVPNGVLGNTFATRSVVSSGRVGLLTVYATATGVSGAPVTIQFKLNVS